MNAGGAVLNIDLMNSINDVINKIYYSLHIFLFIYHYPMVRCAVQWEI